MINLWKTSQNLMFQSQKKLCLQLQDLLKDWVVIYFGGFDIPNGESGVAVLDINSGQQVVINDTNIQKLYNLIKS